MFSEIKTIITIIFKRKGKPEMSYSELYLSLSFELRWFKPHDAKKIINSAISQNLLIKKGSMFSPSFDIDQITIPTGFTPSKNYSYNDKNIVENSKINISDKIINKIAENTGRDLSDIINQIKIFEREMNISFDIASLLFAKKLDLSIDEYFEDIEKQLNKIN